MADFLSSSDVSSKAVKALCLAIQAAPSTHGAESLLSTQAAILGLLRWVCFALTRTCSNLANQKGHPKALTDSTCDVIATIAQTVECLLNNKHSVDGDVESCSGFEWSEVKNEVERLLVVFVAQQRDALIGENSSGESTGLKHGDSNRTTSSISTDGDATVPASRVCLVAAVSLLNMLHSLLRATAGGQVSAGGSIDISWLAQCCVSQETLHAVSKVLAVGSALGSPLGDVAALVCSSVADVPAEQDPVDAQPGSAQKKARFQHRSDGEGGGVASGGERFEDLEVGETASSSRSGKRKVEIAADRSSLQLLSQYETDVQQLAIRCKALLLEPTAARNGSFHQVSQLVLLLQVVACCQFSSQGESNQKVAHPGRFISLLERVARYFSERIAGKKSVPKRNAPPVKGQLCADSLEWTFLCCVHRLTLLVSERSRLDLAALLPESVSQLVASCLSVTASGVQSAIDELDSGEMSRLEARLDGHTHRQKSSTHKDSLWLVVTWMQLVSSSSRSIRELPLDLCQRMGHLIVYSAVLRVERDMDWSPPSSRTDFSARCASNLETALDLVTLLGASLSQSEQSMLPASTHSAVSRLMAVVTLSLSQSFVGESRALDPPARFCAALPPSLRDAPTLQSTASCPESCLFRTRLCTAMCEWKDLAATREAGGLNGASSVLPQLSLQTALKVAPIVLSTTDAVLPHLEQFVARASSDQAVVAAVETDSQCESEASPWFTDCDLVDTDVRTAVKKVVSEQQTNQIGASEYLLHINTLLQLRCAVSSVVMCSAGQVHSDALAMAGQLDRLTMRLAGCCVVGNTARIQLGQLLCVVLMEQTQSSSGSAQSGAVSLQVFLSDIPVQQVFALLRVPFSAKSPVLLSAASGVIRYIKCSSVTHPHHAICALGELFGAWLRVDFEDKTGLNILYEELLHLVDEGLLSHLFLAHVELAAERIVLPLLYADIEQNPLAEYLLKTVLYNHIHGNHIYGKVRESNPIFTGSKLVAMLVTDPQDDHVLTAAEVLGSIARQGYLSVEVAGCERFLVDGYPMVLYHILTSSSAQRVPDGDTRAFVAGKLHQLLEHTARALGKSLQEEHKFGDILPTTQLHEVLSALVWDLGAADEEVAQCSSRALSVLCFLYANRTWKVSRCRDATAVQLSQEMAECTSIVLSDNFLYLMSNVLSGEQYEEKQNQQSRSLRCIRALLGRLRQADLSKYVHKVLVEVGIAFKEEGSSAAVRLEAVGVIEELAGRLHNDVLCSNLSSLVVVLFPLLEPIAPASTTSAPSIAAFDSLSEATLATNDLHRHARWTGRREYDARPSRRGVDPKGFSDDLVLLCAACYSVQLARHSSQRTRDKAVEIIQSLLLTRRDEVHRAVQSIAYLPEVEELGDVRALHAKELDMLTLGQSVKLLCEMMKHDSQQVRTLALNRLVVLCGKHKDELYLPITSRNTFEVNGASSSSLIAILLQELLQLSARETDHSVLAACASCLGELGAIDPNRITLKLLSKTGSTEQQQFLPWNLADAPQVMSFGLHMVEHHLLPGLRSASAAGTQDKSGFAIQQVLRHLGQLSASATANSEVMPELLRVQLRSKGLLGATEAFWLTEYTMKNKFLVRSPPIYFPGVSFSRWISIWTRFLIKKSGGQLQQLFEGCRGIVRERGDLCQFLLPHLIVNILCTHAESDETVTLGIVQEICVVLRDSRDGAVPFDEGRLGLGFQTVTPEEGASRETNEHQLQYHHMCVQSIFVLLDTLRSWLSASTAGQKQLNKVTSSTNLEASPLSMASVHLALQRLFDGIPTDLLCSAALSIKAYTRALRYLEVSTRELHRRNAQSEKTKALQDGSAAGGGAVLRIEKPFRDRTGGALPSLTEPQLDSLMTIFAQVEDCDGLEGTQVLRQILGIKSTAWSRIVALEHSDDWIGALREYGLMHDSLRFTKSVDSQYPRQKRQLTHSLRGDSFAANVRAVKSEGGVVAEGGGESEDLEKGRLRCLVELGHLEAVIDQTLGMAQRLPDLEAQLLPLGVEASWKLMRWDDLSGFLGRLDRLDPAEDSRDRVCIGLGRRDLELQREREDPSEQLLSSGLVSESDRFQLSIGKLMLSMRRRVDESFHADLLQARIQTMSALSAASMESYNRAYPMLTRLHMLREIETGFSQMVMGGSEKGRGGADVSDTSTTQEVVQWGQRLELMAPSISQRTMVLAIRRSLLGICGRDSAIAQNWLQLSTSMRQLGRFESARMAIRHAESCGLNAEEVLLQECRILKDSGQISKALSMLEPVEIDVAAIDRVLKSSRKKPSLLPACMDSEEKRHRLAERIQLATQLMVDSQQKQGKGIVERYQVVIALNKNSEQAFFDCARYNEFLYHDARSKESSVLADEKLTYKYMELALTMYCNSLRTGSKFAMQLLPRMLTLWLAFTSLTESAEGAAKAATAKKTASSGAPESLLRSAQMRANEILFVMAPLIHESVWFMCMPQLVSRVGHRNPDTLQIIITILQRVLVAYPKQGIWHIAGLVHSLNNERKKIARDLLRETYKIIFPKKPTDGQMLVDSQKLFSNLVLLATHQCKDKKIKWAFAPELVLSSFLVPTQTILHHCNPLSHVAALSEATPHNNFSSHNQLFIGSFNEVVDVASSKAKPKTITLLTTSGLSVRFLCKQEKDGDLRKDSRMMEFNSVVNRLLQDDAEGAKRGLRLRTFAVVCLNEECGILEWVNNTDCIRTLISQSHSFWPDQFPNMGYKEIYQNFVEFQTREDDNIAGMMRGYSGIIEAFNYRPCFHKWFLERFGDPTEWLEARNMFTRSAAVWSGVGHVIGLGDRHTENILIDMTNGECVHVDFDCLFDKGLSLLRPEIVPFRLTPNMVDAMGVAGVEGTFRRTLEVAMSLLRANKDTLMSVLEPFLRDPTVAWSRNGRAQRGDGEASGAGRGQSTSSNLDHENKEARNMLLKISERLSGVYNISHPHRDKFIKACAKRGDEFPSRGLGAGRDETLPLSVQGQVQRLIDEATAEENLVQLYIGWQPWV
eukprot:gene21660-27701_t